MLSVNRAWEETQAIIKRDGALLFPVAFALLALPNALFQHFIVSPRTAAMQQAADAGVLNPVQAGPWMLWLIPVVIISIVGTLTIASLTLRSGTSVGEAINYALRRAPTLIAASLLFALVLMIAGVVIGFIAGATGSVAIATLLALLLVPVIIFLFVRLVLISPIAAAEPIGPVALLRRSWALTAGHFWRLFGFFLLFVVVAVVVLLFVTLLVGIVAGLAGGGEVGPIGGLIGQIVSALLNAVISAIFTVAITRIYAQLAGGSAEPVVERPLD